MKAAAVDLLPPIFDQVLHHFRVRQNGVQARNGVVDAFMAALVNAVAENVHERLRAGKQDRQQVLADSSLETSDRLSGGGLSRGGLVERIRLAVDLQDDVVEVALLFIEAQIDLRTTARQRFSVRGITFDSNAETNPASWCEGILVAAMRGVTQRQSVFAHFSRHTRSDGVRILIDGLRLAATLRRAHPYKIKIEQALIEPLVEDRADDPRIRLLHISDLHLVEDITEEGGRKLRPLGVPTHTLSAAQALGSAVRELNPRYDILLATGDLSTDGDKGALETVRQYLQSGSLAGHNPMRIATHGLNAGIGNRLLVPGNHDRYANAALPGQRANGLFEEVLATPAMYPYVVGFRPATKRLDVSALTLLFFVFDSNLPKKPDRWSVGGHIDALARGNVTRQDIEEAFKRLAPSTAQNGYVQDLHGNQLAFTKEKTVRIAVLHHHPIVSEEVERALKPIRFAEGVRHPFKVIGRARRLREEDAVAMEGAQEFLLSAISAGVQLVLFGHQHKPYYRICSLPSAESIATPFGPRPPFVHNFCCPTSLQGGPHGNGFYTFDFLDENRVIVDLYVSRRDDNGVSGDFTWIPKYRRSIDLSKIYSTDGRPQ